jgi:hypothetical protein
MTKAEKYPYSVEALLQREAQSIVRAVWHNYNLSYCDDYTLEVRIRPELWNELNTRQKRYFCSLLGGVWKIIMPKLMTA